MYHLLICDCPVELQTKVREDWVGYHRFLKPPIGYGICTHIPILHLHLKCFNSVLNVKALSGESSSRGLLCNCEIFVNLRLKLYCCPAPPPASCCRRILKGSGSYIETPRVEAKHPPAAAPSCVTPPWLPGRDN